MISIEVDPKFHGPTVAELASTLADIPDNPLKVSWRGSKEEARLFSEHPERDFVLCVPSLAEMSQAAFQFGASIRMGNAILDGGKDALADKKKYNWREFANDAGPSVTRSLVVKLAADAIRAGLKPKLTTVAAEVLQGRANASDADVLIRSGG
jgi:hypothetical protein